MPGAVTPPPALTVAAFMERALHGPGGYYATAARRSGRAGDFYTSVDLGPLFGATVAVQIAEMLGRIDAPPDAPLDLVEAGAGDGRLTRDVLDALASRAPDLYARLRVTLVERSRPARAAARTSLTAHRDRVAGIGTTLPSRLRGVVLANELLDALPVHLLTMTAAGLREIYLTPDDGGGWRETAGPLSDDRLAGDPGVAAPPPGWRGLRSLAIPDWIASVARSLDSGFLLLFDYVARPGLDDTLLAYTRHTASSRWLERPGSRDITAHVDLTGLERAARAAGLRPAGCVDQTYFLLALGLAEACQGDDDEARGMRLAAKTLLLPGGLGSTMKAMAFGARGADTPLRGFTGGRLT